MDILSSAHKMIIIKDKDKKKTKQKTKQNS